MHPEASHFLSYVKQVLADYFTNKIVLDVGSGDINGNNRHLFDNCQYSGNDIISAPNVTIVSKTKDLPFKPESFDTIISSECFEHDPEYRESLLKIFELLKPNGLFTFTCAGIGRPEHGTRRTTPQECYATIGNISEFSDYYRNLSERDVDQVLHLNESFSFWQSYYNSNSKDLYFIGIKKSDNNQDIHIPDYQAPSIVKTTFS